MEGEEVVVVLVVVVAFMGIGVFIFFVLERGIGGQDGNGLDVNVSFGEDYECDFDFYNCNSCNSSEEAQYVFDYCGGVGDDVHGLDGDNDGVVCEGLVDMRIVS